MRTLVAVNTLTSITVQAYSSHCQEWFRMGKDFPDDDFVLYNPHRSSIDRMRNESVKLAQQLECEYVYFIDDDMILTPRTYKALRDADKDVVMAHTIIRGFPYNHMHFIDPEDKGFKSNKNKVGSLVNFNDFQPYIQPDGLLRVDAIGCACVLFKTSIFAELEPPYFVTFPTVTEDVYCCMKLQDKLSRQGVGIYVHLGVPTGHIMEPEVVTAQNRKRLKQRGQQDRTVFKETIDRGNSYSKMVEEVCNQ